MAEISRRFLNLFYLFESYELTKDNPRYKEYEIGEFTYGEPFILKYGGNSTVKIGKFCSIANGTLIIIGADHRTDWITTYPFSRGIFRGWGGKISEKGLPRDKGDIVIGNDVWIGQGVTILSGISIGDGAVIAAKSIVTKSVKPYEVVGGNPSKHIRFRFSEENIEKLLKIQWWNWEISKIIENIELLTSDDLLTFLDRHPLDIIKS
ncbi:MAG: CatB-related O-acetyltransferase [Bacteroidia bacterium]|nr:CatB-related O-acetyltransferase [Bacteroidia bacterium]